MVNKNYNEICLAFDNYLEIKHIDIGLRATKSDTSDEIYSDLSDLVRVLLKNGQQIKIYREDGGIIIQYNYRDADMSEVNLDWLSEEDQK